MKNKLDAFRFHCIRFIKKETVLCIAALLAAVSAFPVPPSAEYFSYIDYRVLALLFSLMLVVAGFQRIGFFRYLGSLLLLRAKSTRSLCLFLVGLCFFSGMLITNDVALLTFVPFAVMLFTMAGQTQLLIPVIVLQTIAANLGSMLTPVGNPQNLYLYSAFGLSMGDFLRAMLPPTLLSGALLLVCTLVLPSRRLDGLAADDLRAKRPPVGKLLLFTSLFAVCLLCVLRVLPWQLMLGVLVVCTLLADKSLLCSIDYCLLLTFVCFFVFIGNMERIPVISSFLRSFIDGRELMLGVLFSQCISNVPAAILLSGFTDKALPLLYGVNLGGLGTLIASLASLISYRLYAGSADARKGTYLKVFTGYNIAFLIPLYVLALFLCH